VFAYARSFSHGPGSAGAKMTAKVQGFPTDKSFSFSSELLAPVEVRGIMETQALYVDQAVIAATLQVNGASWRGKGLLARPSPEGPAPDWPTTMPCFAVHLHPHPHPALPTCCWPPMPGRLGWWLGWRCSGGLLAGC